LAHLDGIAPVVGGSGVDLIGAADECAVLYAGDVRRIRPTQVTVRMPKRIERNERPGLDETLAECSLMLC
jgi:hypothetical protein